MAGNIRTQTSNSAVVSAAAFVVIVAGLRAAQEIVIPVLMAAFLAVISLPILHWFQRRGLSTWIAMLAIAALVAVLGLLIVGIVGSSVNELRLQLPEYQARTEVLKASAIDWLKDRGIDLGSSMDQEIFNGRWVFSLFGSILGSIGSILNNALLIVFLLIFMQLEAADLPAKLRAIAPENSEVADRLERIHNNVWQYTRLKTRTSFLTGALAAAWLWMLGIDFPLLWGLLTFLLNFVPNIGSIIAAVPPIIVAVLQPDVNAQDASLLSSLLLANYAALGYFVINMVVGNILEPRWMGTGAGLSTLVVFLSLVFWGWVLGPVGMVLSVPLTMIVKIVLDNSKDLRWVAILLGSEVRAEPVKKPV